MKAPSSIPPAGEAPRSLRRVLLPREWRLPARRVDDDPEARAIRNRLFWKLQVIGWSGAALAALIFSGLNFLSLREAFLLGVIRAVFGFFATSGMRYGYRWLLRRGGNFWGTGCAMVLVCGAVAIIDGLIMLYLTEGAGLIRAAGFDQILIASILMRWMIYWIWSLLYFGIHYWIDGQQAQLRLARAEAAARSAELQLLRAQVNPHFLFNALNSILAESDSPASVRSLTLALSEYLRFSLQQRDDIQPLGLELEALENYLRVEKIRFEENLEYTLEVDPGVRETLAPVALVQPLLDNAIKYGQCSVIRPLRVFIRARQEGEKLLITVGNTGEWMASGMLASTGTGLANLRRRLQLLYGGLASLETRAEGGEVRVHVELPLVKSGEVAA